MKNEKKNGADLTWATAQIILQEKALYCDITAGLGVRPEKFQFLE